MALVGLEGRIVEVEADIGAGLPRTVLVGLPDSALYQARDRCKAAVSNSGLEWPISLLTINLSPAKLPKGGSHYDFAIVAAVLAAQGVFRAEDLRWTVLLGKCSTRRRRRSSLHLAAFDELGWRLELIPWPAGLLGALPCPFVLDVTDRQPQQFDHRRIVGEMATILDVQGTSSTGTAVRARSIQSGTGVFGSSGTGTGIEGVSAGRGLGVVGRSDSGAGVFGSSTSRVGVDGFSRGRFGAGVRGFSFDDNGNGVYGNVGSAGHSGPQGIGVAGDTLNTDGTGVQGRSFGSGNGVYGISTSGVGVLAHTTSGIAVDGISESGIAVYGHRKVKYDPNAPNSVAGYFDAGIKVVNGPKNFAIDHPLDPQNKYPVHTCIESSEMKNVYDGAARLDKEGAAWVELPEWFEALNGDFRYQLTAVGGSAPGLHVAEEVSENRFKIAGGEEGMKVCWQVTGSRKDPWAAANPFEVEQKKPEEKRGRYLEPSLYDAPEEQRVMIGPIAEAVPQQPPELSDIDLARLEEEHRRQLDELRRQEEEDRKETEELQRQEKAPPEST